MFHKIEFTGFNVFVCICNAVEAFFVHYLCPFNLSFNYCVSPCSRVSHTNVLRILHRHKFYPRKMKMIEYMKENNFERKKNMGRQIHTHYPQNTKYFGKNFVLRYYSSWKWMDISVYWIIMLTTPSIEMRSISTRWSSTLLYAIPATVPLY